MTVREAVASVLGKDGFVTEEAARAIATDPTLRLSQCLVRCGGCRFVAAIQDVPHLTGIILREGSDYVRDVCFVDTSNLKQYESNLTANDKLASIIWPERNAVVLGDGRQCGDPQAGEYGGAFDGTQVTSDADPGL